MISLNTLYYDKFNLLVKGKSGAERDGGQLEWFAEQLKNAEQNGEDVWVIGCVCV